MPREEETSSNSSQHRQTILSEIAVVRPIATIAEAGECRSRRGAQKWIVLATVIPVAAALTTNMQQRVWSRAPRDWLAHRPLLVWHRNLASPIIAAPTTREDVAVEAPNRPLCLSSNHVSVNRCDRALCQPPSSQPCCSSPAEPHRCYTWRRTVAVNSVHPQSLPFRHVGADLL